jgi:hypothetical protein
MLWTAIGIGGIWVAVLLISLFSPDLVSGSEQEHLPVAAITAWFWGVVGTVVFLLAMGRLRGRPSWQPIWVGLSVATLGIWTVATILAITLPVIETGTDPTRVPVVRHRRAHRCGDADGAGGHRRQCIPSRAGRSVACLSLQPSLIRRIGRTGDLGTTLELLRIRGRTATRVMRSAAGAIVEWDLAFHLASLYIR